MEIASEQVDREATLTPTATTLLALPLSAVIILGGGGAYLARWGWPALLEGLAQAFSLPLFAVVFGLGVLIHEGLHALGWKVFGQVPWSAIKFGFMWKALMPYAHCQVPLRAAAYRWGGALPGLLTGLLPAALGLAFGSGVLLVFGLVFLTAAAGDALVLWALRGVPADARVIDHPSRPGCLVMKRQPETARMEVSA